MSAQWTHDEAVALCILVESVCPPHGCHVALTGGSLYKPGMRKDCDILFYRIRQSAEIDESGLFGALESIGITLGARFGGVQKADYQGKAIDMFSPSTTTAKATRTWPRNSK